MKIPLRLGLVILASCGSTAPQTATTAPVVVATPPAKSGPEEPSEPSEPPVPAKPRLQIVISDENVCLRVEASLRCWNRANGATAPILANVAPIAGLGDVTEVAVGSRHVCALNQAGQVYCWGDNASGQLGSRKSDLRVDTPVRVEGIEGAKTITCGTMHSCALLGDGRVSCWGWNGLGQTGSDSEYTTAARELVVPEIVPGISEATSIVAGRAHSCAKMKTGTWCWGESQLKSQQDTRGHSHNQPARVEDLADVEQLVAKDETSCAVFQDKHVGCWGSGAFSVMPSRPLRAESPLPVILPPARSIAVSQYHGCAILQNGRVSCFGWNNHGELGREKQSDYQAHESDIVQGLPAQVDSISVGAATSCAIVRGSELWCWGIPPHMPWVHDAGSGVPARVPL